MTNMSQAYKATALILLHIALPQCYPQGIPAAQNPPAPRPLPSWSHRRAETPSTAYSCCTTTAAAVHQQCHRQVHRARQLVHRRQTNLKMSCHINSIHWYIDNICLQPSNTISSPLHTRVTQMRMKGSTG